MLAPKEKAQELVDKYYDIEWLYEGYNIFMPKEKAKQCALIVVNEMLNVIQESYDLDHIKYWQEVKQEIENQK